MNELVEAICVLITIALVSVAAMRVFEWLADSARKFGRHVARHAATRAEARSNGSPDSPGHESHSPLSIGH